MAARARGWGFKARRPGDALPGFFYFYYVVLSLSVDLSWLIFCYFIDCFICYKFIFAVLYFVDCSFWRRHGVRQSPSSEAA